MATVEELLQATDDVLSDGARRGAMHNVAEDEWLDGRTVTVHGQRLVNFGSCSYLGLETHPALRAGAIEATERYGTQFSSSRAYLSAPAYTDTEALLSTIFDRPAMITSSTSLGHIATMPTVVGARDALVMDHQVHHSVQTAARLAAAQGTTTTLVPHSDMARLEKRVAELSRTHRRIWFAFDGLYSMYADYAPIDAINELMSRYDQLWLYVDDAHAVSWSGTHGRGFTLDALTEAARQRAVVAGSLNKSFAAAGGVFTFPDAELRRLVFTVGGPMVFSGPVQPPMLGAVQASARLHLNGGVAGRREHLADLIRLFNDLAAEAGLPLVSPSEAPIRCVGVGVPRIAYNVTGRLREAGYFVDTAVFPGVPAKRCGTRVALTANHTREDVAGLVAAIADALPRALAEEGSSADVVRRVFARQLDGRPVRLRPVAEPAAGATLKLERHVTVGTVDKAEWNAMFGTRGAFDWDGLHGIEEVFAGRQAEPEHSWTFNYWIVRDGAGSAVAATFFTTGLWKDDMLSAREVSAEVERRRESDPSYLTSTVVMMGCLLTEGDHLYLRRDADWRGALRLILAGARDEEDRADASAVVLRDLPDGDDELHEFLRAEGFLRIPIYDTWVRRIDFTGDDGFLAGLPHKARYHQRTRVLAWEDRYDVRVLGGGTPQAVALTGAERDELYALYRNVHARGLDLNVFPLPRRLFDMVLGHPSWEVVVLTLPEVGPQPVAVCVQHVGPTHVAPLFAGLDYRYVASHQSYQQVLWQALRSAQRRGAGRVLLGMSADLQKSRFGAKPEKRWVYIQPTESYQTDLLTQLTERVALGAGQ